MGGDNLSILETVQKYIKVAINYLEPAMAFLVIAVFLLALFFAYYRKVTKPLAGTTEWIAIEINKPKFSFLFQRHPMEKRDIAPLALITAAFAFLALFQLGDTAAPQSFFQFTRAKHEITIELENPAKINALMFYTGLWTGYYTLEFSGDGIHWEAQGPVVDAESEKSPDRAMDQPHSHLFKWRYAWLNAEIQTVRFLRIRSSSMPMELGELAIFDTSGKLIPRSEIYCPDAPELFDEQELVPDKPEYMNSMYFDEIYHGRTALEFLRNIRPYETTHPPLGKEIIAVSIYVFGMTPFGWRFSGAVFGVAMLVVMYLLLKNIFGKTPVAICGTLLFGFDFMRFTQTRIATIDTYGVFFILLSFFFMYRHIATDADAKFGKSLLSLALAGLSFGLGCASKWIVPYAGIGLAAIYALRLVMLSKHYKKNELPGFGRYLMKTLLFSALFFVIVPVIIYYLSYIPYGLARGMRVGDGMLWDYEYAKIVWDNQVSMLNYHSRTVLEATHPYSSRWYQWIIDARPILYFNSSSDNIRSSFAAFGNPAVWWGGLLAMVALAIRVVRKRDGKALFIIIGYLSQLLPWVAVRRIVFIYHYFPSVIFLVLAMAYIFNTIIERRQGRYMGVIYGYTAYSGALFGMFYPVLSGVYAPQWYFTWFLRWIPRAWPF